MKFYSLIFLKIIFLSKKIFFKPKSSKVLIFDEAGSQLLVKIFKFKNYQILNTRFETINFFILTKVLLRFKFNLLEYYIEYIKNVNPDLIITQTDNNIKFYELKSFFAEKKFVSIQNGLRTRSPRDIFYLLKTLNQKQGFKKKYSCDFFFVFNQHIAKEYSKYINAKYIVAGSLRNNLIKVSKTIFQKSILFISQYRLRSPLFKKFGYEVERIILPVISDFCRDNKILFNILPSSKDYSKLNCEIKYYKDILKNNNFNVIKNKNRDKSYVEVDKYENIIFIDSTLGYEAISRKKKVAIFSLRKVDNILDYFGWPKKKNQSEIKFNNCISYDKKIINKTLNNLFCCNQERWNKNFFPYLKQFMKYDYGNKILKKIIKKILIN
jgi:surface carbohydrate biosynthesis protein